MSLRERVLSMVSDLSIRGVPPEGLSGKVMVLSDDLLKPSTKRFYAGRTYKISADILELIALVPYTADEIEKKLSYTTDIIDDEDILKLIKCLSPHIIRPCRDKNTDYNQKRVALNYLYYFKSIYENNHSLKIRTDQTPDTMLEIEVQGPVHNHMEIFYINGNILVEAD